MGIPEVTNSINIKIEAKISDLILQIVQEDNINVTDSAVKITHLASSII